MLISLTMTYITSSWSFDQTSIVKLFLYQSMESDIAVSIHGRDDIHFCDMCSDLSVNARAIHAVIES